MAEAVRFLIEVAEETGYVPFLDIAEDFLIFQNRPSSVFFWGDRSESFKSRKREKPEQGRITEISNHCPADGISQILEIDSLRKRNRFIKSIQSICGKELAVFLGERTEIIRVVGYRCYPCR